MYISDWYCSNDFFRSNRYSERETSFGFCLLLNMSIPSLFNFIALFKIRTPSILCWLLRRKKIFYHSLSFARSLQYSNVGLWWPKFGALWVKTYSTLGIIKGKRVESLNLAHIHSLGVIHRDVKPENVLLRENGHLLLSDFGCAKIIGEQNGEINRETTKGPRRKCSFVGTAQYVSPEVGFLDLTFYTLH